MGGAQVTATTGLADLRPGGDAEFSRGVLVDHTTIYRWVQKHAPELSGRNGAFNTVALCRRRIWAGADSSAPHPQLGRVWRFICHACRCCGDCWNLLAADQQIPVLKHLAQAEF